MKSVKSINLCKSVVQTIYDIVKAHGGELSWRAKKEKEVSLLLGCPSSESRLPAETLVQAGINRII